LITKDGVSFDPKNMEALQTMQEPQNGADLVQYVAAVNWMRSAFSNYSKHVAPLQAALAKVFEGKRRRTKKAAAAVSLLHLWGPEGQAAFKDLQAAIIDSMTLAFPDPDKMSCVLTNASDRFYDGLVTQTDEEQVDLLMKEQDNQPFAFLSRELKGAKQRWTVPEKEGFAIVDTVTEVDYLLLSHDVFSILSDHLKLAYIYNPLSAGPTARTKRMERWPASFHRRASARPTTILWRSRRRRRSDWCNSAMSMSTSVASKAMRRLVKKYRRRKSMLAA
jgi:RNase H-like domain found in reverse transcriptase